VTGNLSPFHEPPRWQRWLRGGAGVASVGLHAALAFFLLGTAAVVQEDTWVEMVVNEVKPPPPPPPPPPPEPPKPKPTPKAPVKFEDLPKTPPPDAPPPAAEPSKPAPRRLGVTMNSVATGANTGLSVRTGNTTATRQDDTRLGPDDAAFSTRPFYQVAEPPKLLDFPPLQVTKEAIDAEIEGTLTALVDLDAEGRPTRVRVVKGLGYGLDEACRDAWMKSRWKPAKQDGVAVAVTGVPRECKVKKEQ